MYDEAPEGLAVLAVEVLPEIEEGDQRESQSDEGTQSSPGANTTALLLPDYPYHALSAGRLRFLVGGHADYILLRHHHPTSTPAA